MYPLIERYLDDLDIPVTVYRPPDREQREEVVEILTQWDAETSTSGTYRDAERVGRGEEIPSLALPGLVLGAAEVLG